MQITVISTTSKESVLSYSTDNFPISITNELSLDSFSQGLVVDNPLSCYVSD